MPHKPSFEDHVRSFRSYLANDMDAANKILLEHPAVIDAPAYGSSESCLHYWAIENRVDIVDWLISKGSSADGIAEDETPLIVASQLGHLDICRLLVSSGADINRVDYSEETALQKASQYGYIEIIELLLKFGADPTIQEMCGEVAEDQALERKKVLVKEVFSRFKKKASNPKDSF